MPVEKIAEGRYRIRLRYGKGLRDRFVIVARTSTLAEIKAERMQRMANELAACGKHVEAKAVIEEAGLTETEADMLEAEATVRELCAEEPAVDTTVLSGKTTFGQVAELMLQKQAAEGNKPRTLAMNRHYLKVLWPRLGKVPVASITSKIADEAMGSVPPEVDASRNLYEGFVSRVLKHAVRLELIASVPLRSDFVSKQKPPKRLFQYLRVDEEWALVTCSTVPLERRVGYALMSREGVRPEFLTQFFWADAVDPNASVSTIDLESGLLTHRHKQRRVRRWLVCERVLRVLRAWRESRPGSARVLPTWNHGGIAELLRKDLMQAGVTRLALHRSTSTERQIAAKDAGRATFVTLALRAGAPMHWVTDRTGHATQDMVERYTRMARESRDTVRAWLRPMDEAFCVDLGLKPLEGRYVTPWLQGIQVAEPVPTSTQPIDELGQQVGHLIEMLSRSGMLPTFESTSRSSQQGTVASPDSAQNKGVHESDTVSQTPTQLTGPAGLSGVGHEGPVELALASAIEAATRAERWDVVLAATAELRERRLERRGQ